MLIQNYAVVARDSNGNETMLFELNHDEKDMLRLQQMVQGILAISKNDIKRIYVMDIDTGRIVYEEKKH